MPCERPVLDELAAVAEIAAQAGLKPDAIVPEQARLLSFTLEKIPALGIPDFDEVYGAARAAFPGVRLGGGVFTNFTELNRNCAEPALFDFLTHSTCAVVHEPDDRSVMETLQTLPDIVASAKAWAGGKPYRIAPSAIGMRFNPYGPDVHQNSRQRALLLQPPGPAPPRPAGQRLHPRLCRARSAAGRRGAGVRRSPPARSAWSTAGPSTHSPGSTI